MSQFTLTVFEPIDVKQRECDRSVARSSDDVALLERFQRGDNPALVELFDRHNRRLTIYCLKLLGDRDLAKDVTQTLWERVLRLRERPRRIDNPAGFFVTIARNLCLNQIESRRRFSSLESLPEPSYQAFELEERSEREQEILDALDRLSFEHREVIVLNIYCGYRLEEIAEMLGKSPDAIWKRASRARKQLREMVSRNNDE